MSNLPKDSRLLFDEKWLKHFHLDRTKDTIVTIESVSAGEVVGEGGQTSRKPVLKFVGKQLPFAISKTDDKTIQSLYGADSNNWAGKKLALYVTKTKHKGEMVDCIRCRPFRPGEKATPTPKNMTEVMVEVNKQLVENGQEPVS